MRTSAQKATAAMRKTATGVPLRWKKFGAPTSPPRRLSINAMATKARITRSGSAKISAAVKGWVKRRPSRVMADGQRQRIGAVERQGEGRPRRQRADFGV